MCQQFNLYFKISSYTKFFFYLFGNRTIKDEYWICFITTSTKEIKHFKSSTNHCNNVCPSTPAVATAFPRMCLHTHLTVTAGSRWTNERTSIALQCENPLCTFRNFSNTDCIPIWCIQFVSVEQHSISLSLNIVAKNQNP